MKWDINRAFIAGTIALAIGAFVSGRHREIARLAAERAQQHPPAATESASVEATAAPDFRQLPIDGILALPFTEFYEALRSAPSSARAKWAEELEKMPPGLRKTAAVRAFYKLLVQFDPKEAIRAVTNYQSNTDRAIAISAVVSAAPASALPDIAKMLAGIHGREYFDDLDAVLLDWSLTDPAAALKFLDEHQPDWSDYAKRDLIYNWAALDPVAARKWIDEHPAEPDSANPDAFITGWYLSDRPAAVKYVIEHAGELIENRTAAAICGALYYDGKDEADKFIAALPNDEIRRQVLVGFAREAGYGMLVDNGQPEQAPRAIADWIARYPADQSSGAFTELFDAWSISAPQEMLDWIVAQPLERQGQLVDEFTTGATDTAKTVLQPLFQLSDETLRDRLLTALFRHLGSGVDDVLPEINNLAISPYQKSHVLQIANQVAAERAEDNEAAARPSEQ